MIGQHGHAKKCIGEFFSAPLHIAKFGRLMQTLARLERQFTDLDCLSALGTEALAPLGAAPSQQSTATLGGHARTKTVGTGTM